MDSIFQCETLMARKIYVETYNLEVRENLSTHHTSSGDHQDKYGYSSLYKFLQFKKRQKQNQKKTN